MTEPIDRTPPPRWFHAICVACDLARRDAASAARRNLEEAAAVPCCYCGHPTSGDVYLVYLHENPPRLACHGQTGIHQDRT